MASIHKQSFSIGDSCMRIKFSYLNWNIDLSKRKSNNESIHYYVTTIILRTWVNVITINY